MRFTLSELEPVTIPPVDNHQAAHFMQHLTGNEDFDFQSEIAPRMLMIYELEYDFPGECFASGWLLSVDYETLGRLFEEGNVTVEDLTEKYIIGRLSIVFGGDSPEVTVVAEPV
jgi:hypothetical protein